MGLFLAAVAPHGVGRREYERLDSAQVVTASEPLMDGLDSFTGLCGLMARQRKGKGSGSGDEMVSTIYRCGNKC